MVKAKRWALVNQFHGVPKEEDLRLEEENIPELKQGEVLIEALYVSVDPYLRGLSQTVPDGGTMVGTQVAWVIESKHTSHPVGQFVLSSCGWRSHTVVDPNAKPPVMTKLTPELGADLSPSLGLGIVGMPGATAYFGLLRIGELKKGDVVYVNGAAGAVGSAVGQIAKIKGCKVVGCAGTDDKCEWLREVAGFDHVFNYKTCNVVEELEKAAPEGIDVFFDNVGGDVTMEIVQKKMNTFGRVAICGSISGYNDTTPKKLLYPFSQIIYKQIKLHGFVVSNFMKEFPTAHKDIAQWIRSGQLKYKEHMVDGFENIPKTFIGLFHGANTGKAIIKVK